MTVRKIVIACGAGGHLTQMMMLKEAYEHHNCFIITYDRENTKDLENAYLLPYDQSLSGAYSLKTVTIVVQLVIGIVKVLARERPDVIISTGGGDIALPTFFFGKLMGAKLIYIETIARVDSPSSLGKLLYWLSDHFFVQSPDLLKCYGDKAQYCGRVL